MIKISNIKKSYGNILAVDGVSFEVKKGEVIGLLGPNGAGKTTTMKILTGFIKKDGGKVIVDGIDIEEDKHLIQKKIGYLPENCPLYEELTIYEYLTYVSGMREIKQSEQKLEISRVMELCGIEKRKNMIIGDLSKGYKQRTGLAGALIGNPPILILDEPTSGLDPNQILEIRKLLSNIAHETKSTIILSTHIMQEAESMCDRVIIIHKGKVVADSSVEELTKSKSKKTGLIVDIEIKGAKNDIENTLSKLKNSLEIVYVKKHENNHIFRITFDIQRDDLPKTLSELLKMKLEIFAFSPSTESLEDIFASLTKN